MWMPFSKKDSQKSSVFQILVFSLNNVDFKLNIGILNLSLILIIVVDDF